MKPRIGVYICHCGTNIAGVVNVSEVVRYAEDLPNVTVAREYKYMCSDTGQDLIIKDIGEHELNRVVVASCSPRMHEETFRRACLRGGVNPYLFAMSNIREQCSWVTVDPVAATEKAKHLVAAAVGRVALQESLVKKEVPVNPATLVVGGGIAGIQVALDIAEAGKTVYLVERESSIGGHMAYFDKTFPTLDCAACILTPKMVAVGQNENIQLLTFCEVVDVQGYIGNFRVKIRKKTRYVDVDKCTGCGTCWTLCPSRSTPKAKTIRIHTKFGDQLVRRAADGNGGDA